MKEYIIDLWEVRKAKLYREPCSTQLLSQSSAGNLMDGSVVGGQRNSTVGKLSQKSIID